MCQMASNRIELKRFDYAMAEIKSENRSCILKTTLDIATRPVVLVVDSGAMITTIAEDLIKKGTDFLPIKHKVSGVAGKEFNFTTKGVVE